jgi:hypothetical protein
VHFAQLWNARKTYVPLRSRFCLSVLSQLQRCGVGVGKRRRGPIESEVGGKSVCESLRGADLCELEPGFSDRHGLAMLLRFACFLGLGVFLRFKPTLCYLSFFSTVYQFLRRATVGANPAWSRSERLFPTLSWYEPPCSFER